MWIETVYQRDDLEEKVDRVTELLEDLVLDALPSTLEKIRTRNERFRRLEQARLNARVFVLPEILNEKLNLRQLNHFSESTEIFDNSGRLQ